jgi:hypothetical protein
MKIILTRSADVDSTLFAEVANFLQAVPGSVVSAIPISTIKMIPDGSDNEWKTPEFDDFFAKCDGLRQFSGQPIDKDDIVVLLTGIPNDQNWFSAFQLPTSKRNIFICAEDWEYYVPESKVHFAIAYQVIENCIQVLMDLDYENEENSSYIHSKSKGCLNDFCGDKRDISLKFRTADICETCLDKINQYPEATAFLSYAHYVMNQVREKFVTRPENMGQWANQNGISLEINPGMRRIRICTGSTTLVQIELSALRFALYYSIIKFSGESGGISPNQLADRSIENREVFDFIRQVYHNNENESAITNLGKDPDMFSQYRSKINHHIKKEITNQYPNRPERLLEKIQISPSQNGIYKVSFEGEIRVIDN